MDTLLQDLKFAVRMLRKNLSTTAVAVLTLALAIGATTSIFTVVSAMLVRPLPFPHPEQLVAMQDVEPGFGGEHGFSWPEVVDVRGQVPDLAGFAAWDIESFNLTGRGEPLRVTAGLVSKGFFEILGTPPMVGRSFAAEEHVENGPAVVVAAPGFWHRVLGEAPPGTTLLLGGLPYTLIGVASSSPSLLVEADVWMPLERKLPWTDRGQHYLDSVARLAPGVGLARAQADLAAVMPRIAKAAGEDHLASMRPLQDWIYGSAAPLLMLLLAAVGLVLLIAAVNLANVVLARATGRVREFAVRRALGAGGARLARQLLVENALIGVVGGGLGVLFALWGRDLILRAWPATMPKIHGGAPLDGRVLLFAAAVSIGSGLAVGLLPAVQAARGDLNTGLKEGAGATGRGRARAALVIAQSAMAALLLIGATLVLRSFSQMLSTSPGFRAQNAIVLRVGLPEGRYPTPERRARFFHEVLERISALPGVHAAGAAHRIPLGGGSTNGDFSVEGRPPLADKDKPYAEKRIVTPGYFAAMQIPLVAGRFFAESDHDRVVMINQALARKIFPGEDPIGRQIRAGMFTLHDDLPATIVGIAADVKQHRLNKEALSEIYFPQWQVGTADMDLVVAGEADAAALIGAVKAQIAAVDPDQPVASIRTLTQVIARAAAPQRLAATLLAVFAGAALLLAALGIYGVISYGVSRREREIGVRMALGAQAVHVIRMVLRDGLRLSVAGIVAGAVVALALARLLAGFLYGVSARDPATYFGACICLLLVAAAATLLPARRATKVDPAVSLRAE